MKAQPPTLLVFSFLTLLGLVIPVWVLAKKQTPQLNGLSESELKQVVIRLERTTCYGSCPAYKLTIHGDGSVEYEGGKYVKVKEKREGTIKPEDLKQLVAEFDKAAFFSIEQFGEQSCTSCTVCTDMPTAITSIQVKGATHSVNHYYGCRCAPKAIWDLETAIDKIVQVQQWTGDVGKQGPLGTTCFQK